jgi:choline kinase
MAHVQVVILAAGMGTRLGRPVPKALTPLDDGRTILGQQLENVAEVLGDRARVTVVVGFKLELILEAAPDVSFVYNEVFDQTNTAVSLLKALRQNAGLPVVWLNGDVVFEAEVLRRLLPLVDDQRSGLCVNTSSVGDEEVKYTVDAAGLVRALSKVVPDGLGEAVGVNTIAAADVPTVVSHLERCAETDYFERALETAIAEDGLALVPVDISDLFAVEVDVADDLERARAYRRG